MPIYDGVESNYTPPPPPSSCPCGWQYFLRVRLQRENTEKAVQPAIAAHGLSSPASINSRELNERMRSASTYEHTGPFLPPYPTRYPTPYTPYCPLSLPLLSLFRSTGQGYIFLTVSSRTTKPAAHFWGLVGFLIKAAAVTPTPRMHGIVRGIFGRKNHPSPLATTVPRSPRRGAAKPALFNNHPFDPFSSPRLSNRGSRFSMPRSANLFRTTFARQSGALGYSKIDIEKRSEFFEMKIVDNNRFDAKVQRVSFNSLGFFFLSHFSFFPSLLFLSSFRKRQEWKRVGGETGNNNFSEIARLFPQKENPIYAQGEARRESIFAGPPLRFNI